MPENCVVTLAKSPAADTQGHDYVSRTAMAQRLADFLGYPFAGEYEPDRGYRGHLYFVPQETLLRTDAQRLGIRSERDLFGGVVPDRFVGTKAITHATFDDAALVPPRWSHRLADALRGVVLPGYTAFSAADAARAARALLAHGRVRIKPAHALGGAGQHVASNDDELDAAIAGLNDDDTREHGVTLEINIEAPHTLSIGEVRVADVALAYCGTQRTVYNHAGEAVYGGSDLRIVRGGFADLLKAGPPSPLKLAIEQVQTYDAAIQAAFPHFFASRRNYDVLQGKDCAGEFVSGVLEQSWRLGGASPAEIAALHAFKRDPSLRLVEASSHESYEAEPFVPDDAVVYFDEDDARAGRLCKYSCVRAVPNA